MPTPNLPGHTEHNDFLFAEINKERLPMDAMLYTCTQVSGEVLY
jgi:hypothetical protein